MTKILGISAFYHDSAAALLDNGNIVAAAQEERFTRIKHDSSYPWHSINYVLNEANLKLSEIDAIVFYEKPFLKFERLLETYLAFAPIGFKSFSISMAVWLREKLFQKKFLFDKLNKQDSNFADINKIKFSEHHYSHAASAFLPSPFSEAIILTLDGVGEWATTTVAIGKDNKIDMLKEIHFPHSLGLLYSAFTYYTGFKVNGGEYKLMGLAPYGSPKYTDKILNNLINVKDDGSFKLNLKYFDYGTGLKMTNENFNDLFGQKVRNSKLEEITQFHMDIASSIQKVTENIVLKICKSLKNEYKIDNLCLAGGVALNCVANGNIYKEKIFKNIWVQPAAGDAGGALGAALAYYHLQKKNKRNINALDDMKGSYLGPEFDDEQIKNILNKIGAKYKKFSEDEMIEKSATSLADGKTIGWFQGRMEFGPRALGNRSILADPRSREMQKNLNLKIKFRESFRPFAPSVLKDKVGDWFDYDSDSPYMLMVAKVKKDKQVDITKNEKNLFGIDKLNIARSEIPAVTHVDYSARIQTVEKNKNQLYYKLIAKFYELTKVPILVNTSFNIRGEPIVCSIEDAYRCFLTTDLDLLICGNYILNKEDQYK